jgi:hypothetical protein
MICINRNQYSGLMVRTLYALPYLFSLLGVIRDLGSETEHHN